MKLNSDHRAFTAGANLLIAVRTASIEGSQGQTSDASEVRYSLVGRRVPFYPTHGNTYGPFGITASDMLSPYSR
jgi:hypothetical protein